MRKQIFLFGKDGKMEQVAYCFTAFGFLYSDIALLIMSDQVTICQLKFNGIANDMLHAKYRAFQANVQRIDRRGNENVYQMTRKVSIISRRNCCAYRTKDKKTHSSLYALCSY